MEVDVFHQVETKLQKGGSRRSTKLIIFKAHVAQLVRASVL